TPLDIMSMIGVVLLVGIVAKNAILLIDFAKWSEEAGMERREALIQAGRVRLRPILMTTFALVAGMIPVALGSGEGGDFRAPLGISVIGGVVTSTLLTLLVIPTVYESLADTRDWLFARIRGEKRHHKKAHEPGPKPEARSQQESRMHNPFVPETLEGWSLLHLMYRVKWDQVRALSDADRARLADEAVAAVSTSNDGPTAFAQMLGHKADLMVTCFRRSFDSLAAAQLGWSRVGLATYLEPTTSYVSIVELGMYEMTAKIHEQ